MNGYNAEKIKAKRDARRAAGMCTDCGKNPAFGHYIRCADCLYKEIIRKSRRMTRELMDRDNARQRTKYHQALEEGRCPVCKKPNPDTNYNCCPVCRKKGRESWHKRYVPCPHPPGICPRCSKPSRPGAVLCEEHYAKTVEAGRKGCAVQNRTRHPWRLDEEVRRSKVMQHDQTTL